MLYLAVGTWILGSSTVVERISPASPAFHTFFLHILDQRYNRLLVNSFMHNKYHLFNGIFRRNYVLYLGIGDLAKLGLNNEGGYHQVVSQTEINFLCIKLNILVFRTTCVSSGVQKWTKEKHICVHVLQYKSYYNMFHRAPSPSSQQLKIRFHVSGMSHS
jgi:hypothetical protein